MATETHTRRPRGPRVVATYVTMMSTALGVAVGFAWNTAVQELNHAIFSQPRYAVLAGFVWALAVTVAAVFIVINLRMFVPEEVPHMPEETHDPSHAT